MFHENVAIPFIFLFRPTSNSFGPKSYLNLLSAIFAHPTLFLFKFVLSLMVLMHSDLLWPVVKETQLYKIKHYLNLSIFII